MITILTLSFNAQIEGSWSLNPAAGALGVGPDSANTSWWAIGAGDVATRACLFDDSIVFNSNGTYDHYMDGSTWLESWQAGSPPEGCGTPIAPHDGGSHTYTYANGVLTVSGPGAHVGLAKVHNTGEDGAPVNDQITYHVTFSGASSEIMTIDISFPNPGGTNGLGWWRYVYLKNGAPPPPPPPSHTVTFNVHTDLIAGNVSADGIYIGGGFVGSAKFGSEVHDEIGWNGNSYIRHSNNAGGIEGGMSNGQPIVLSLAMKPIPTLIKPLKSVDIHSKKEKDAHKERTDSCAVPAASVVAESMLCFAIEKTSACLYPISVGGRTGL